MLSNKDLKKLNKLEEDFEKESISHSQLKNYADNLIDLKNTLNGEIEEDSERITEEKNNPFRDSFKGLKDYELKEWLQEENQTIYDIVDKQLGLTEENKE